MNHLHNLKSTCVEALHQVFGLDLSADEVVINETRREFSGDYTIVLFSWVKLLKVSPSELGQKLGEFLTKHNEEVADFEVVQGFLNVTMTDQYWIKQLSDLIHSTQQRYHEPNGQKVMIEFASPNTNKPLHLGHIRNILLGWSCSKILEAAGYDIIRTQIVNDRGVAICKSMLAWRKYGNGITPSMANIKSDHFVGNYYVAFEKAFSDEYTIWQESIVATELYNQKGKEGQSKLEFFKTYKNQYFNEYSNLGKEVREMLLDWESGHPETIELWKQMNNWVYEGFDVTYKNLGVTFDCTYFESDTYLLGKEVVDIGLSKGVFYKEEDNSVWINLEDVGMDKKVILRKDGTSVYVTQDIGTAHKRYLDHNVSSMVYTVADEQDYHFKVLFEILKRLGEPYADKLFHLSYGMVDLTTGKMKSREGTVVDADDLISEVVAEAASMSQERGEIAALPEQDQKDILRKIGLAALKYFIIKVHPKKRMTFDPKESVDMQGQTGPYIQNAYVRIKSLLRKSPIVEFSDVESSVSIAGQEKALIKHLLNYPSLIKEAASTYDPSIIANFVYSLAKDFHRFYHDMRILNAESQEVKKFRIQLSSKTGEVLSHALDLLGIEVPERM